MASINYTILKSIIETTIKNYNMKEESYKINENHIFLAGLSENGLDLMIQCPHTGRQTNIHAEVNFMQMPADQLPNVTDSVVQTPTTTPGGLTDSDVMEVRQALKSKDSVEDLFGDNTDTSN